MSSRSARAAAVLALATFATGCAWSNRDNRPVWNAFESELVPQDDTWFVVTLPLTVPGGILAILTDTFIVHPATVVDDAYEDTADLWRDRDFASEYYTELAIVPFRAALTPIWFVGSFLGRSAFDVTEDEVDPEQVATAEAERELERTRRLRTWLGALATGGSQTLFITPPSNWDPGLQAAFDRAHAEANPLGRAALFESARRMKLPPMVAAPWLGLLDPDPVVRYLEFTGLDGVEVPAELQAQLRDDPNEAVRLAARMRWR